MPAKGVKKAVAQARSKVDARHALELRARGLSYDQIADQIGHKNRSSVSRLIHAELKRSPVEEIEDLRKLDTRTLERLMRELDGLIAHKDPAVQLKAIQGMLALLARRARLFGLDAPTKTELTGKGGGPILVAEASADDLKALTDEELEEALRRGHVERHPHTQPEPLPSREGTPPPEKAE